MSIEIKNLSKKFNEVYAVKNVNFTIGTNKTIGLLGPNGCGKTTSIGMILGLIKPTSGEIIIDNKNVQKFICNVDKNLKLIGITYTGKVFHIDWESNINSDYKLDNKSLGNIDPNEIINFHSIKKGIKNYLCILNSDGRFKKVLFDEDMINSNRSFGITKLKNDIKTIDSFVSSEEKNLLILTSIGRIFKFSLSNKF